MDKLEILKQFPFFRDSDRAFQEEIVGITQPAKLPVDAYYFHEGDMCAQLALVGAGKLRVYKVGETGREITLYHVGPGECCLLNISCLMTDTPCSAEARVEAPVDALVIPRPVFRRWMTENEKLRGYVFSLLATRMTVVMSLVEEIAFKRMDQRMAEFLTLRFADKDLRDNVLHLTHEQIAAELGTAREVVSRLLKEFERVGAIKLGRASIELADVSLLHPPQSSR